MAALTLTWQTHLPTYAHSPTHFHALVICERAVHNSHAAIRQAPCSHTNTHRQWGSAMWLAVKQGFSDSFLPEEASSRFCWVVPPAEVGKSDWECECVSVCIYYHQYAYNELTHGPDLTSLTVLITDGTPRRNVWVCLREKDTSCAPVLHYIQILIVLWVFIVVRSRCKSVKYLRDLSICILNLLDFWALCWRKLLSQNALHKETPSWKKRVPGTW